MFRCRSAQAKTVFLVISLFMTMAKPSFAQSNKSEFVDSSIRDITLVMATGAGGAVLGLSTLSFVDEPEDHLRNIVVGGAIGIIIGVGLVAYNQANESKDDFRGASVSPPDRRDFSTAARHNWHQQEYHARNEQMGKENPSLIYSFNF